jgi:hypothetical protein
VSVKKGEVLDESRQAELCYQDTLKVIADAKQKLFDVTKWVVTLQSLILGVSFSKETSFSSWIIALPAFVGLMGLFLNYAISIELQVHRGTLAKLRKKIGGLVYDMNKDHVDYFLDDKQPTHKNYYKYYRNANAGIVSLASILAFVVVLSQELLN